jgi:hypothetical protein
MATYKILSDRLTVGNKGQIIDETALEGANIAALIDGGHIAPVTNKKTEDTDNKDK